MSAGTAADALVARPRCSKQPTRTLLRRRRDHGGQRSLRNDALELFEPVDDDAQLPRRPLVSLYVDEPLSVEKGVRRREEASRCRVRSRDASGKTRGSCRPATKTSTIDLSRAGEERALPRHFRPLDVNKCLWRSKRDLTATEVTIPVEVRAGLGIDQGTYLEVSADGDEIRLRKVVPARPLSGDDPIWSLIGVGESGYK